MWLNDGEDVPTRPLFRKYFLTLFVVVIVPLLINGFSEVWFGYRERRSLLDERLRVEASAAADRIHAFLNSIRDQLGWVVHLPWTEENAEGHRVDALRLLRQVPAIFEIALLDGGGTERLKVSRVGKDVMGGETDRSEDPAFLEAREARIWHGPVTLNRGSEPYMVIAVAGNRTAAGVAVARVNLKLIWDIISQIQVGESGLAFVFDGAGRLVAHPDIDVVLRGNDESMIGHIERLLASTETRPERHTATAVVNTGTVLAAMTPVLNVGWTVVAEQPLAEAYAPIRAALWRTLLLILAGAALALVLAYVLARRMVVPIRLLEQGAAQIGAGRFDHRIEINTRDELQRLADRFNEMANELALSVERQERITRLKQFLSPQVAEIVDSSNDRSLLDPRRAEVVVVFCDLRGFTDFSSSVEPEELMCVVTEYYDAVGENITRHEATLTHFSGDGVMILVNAPVPCGENPVLRASKLALDIQASVQALIVDWRARGYALGFGVGLAMGEATVGSVGYQERHDYTAIGSVVNLASRICGSAVDGQILLDQAAARAAGDTLELSPLEPRRLKGFAEPVLVSALLNERSHRPRRGDRFTV